MISSQSEPTMKKTIFMLCVAALFLPTTSLAADSPEKSTGSKGETTFTLSCSGTGKDWRDCYQEAETICPDGYNIIKKSTGIFSMPVNGKSTLAPSKKLVITCK